MVPGTPPGLLLRDLRPIDDLPSGVGRRRGVGRGRAELELLRGAGLNLVEVYAVVDLEIHASKLDRRKARGIANIGEPHEAGAEVENDAAYHRRLREGLNMSLLVGPREIPTRIEGVAGIEGPPLVPGVEEPHVSRGVARGIGRLERVQDHLGRAEDRARIGAGRL